MISSPTPCIHPNALCESNTIGKNTKIWAFVHILPRARIGMDCNICDHVFIENDVEIGNRVTIKCGVQVWDGITIEDDVFIGPNVTFTNDLFPRSKIYPSAFAQTIIEKGASIGANATILPGIVIGKNAMIGAGSVVTKSVPPGTIVAGNPAKIIGYVEGRPSVDLGNHIPQNMLSSLVRNVGLYPLNIVSDMRGNLSVGEFGQQIPFVPRRYFLIYDVPTGEIRGEHAHYKCHQFLIAISGSVSVTVDDSEHKEEFLLNTAAKGLYIPPLIWGVQHSYSSNAMLLVFASDYYDPDDYIRDYSKFLSTVSNNKAKKVS